MTTSPATIHETHSAVVLLLDEHAYKFKKPVDLGFLDFRDEQVRRDVCRREVELNRRLAPDVYLDAVTVTGAGGRGYDFGVLMRRMPDELRLSSLIVHGKPVEGHLRSLARLMAAFHAGARRCAQISAEGTAAGLRRRWTANLRETEQFRGTILTEQLHDRISRLALRYIEGRTTLLAERAKAGLVVDGHGDLIADDVFCLPDHPRVLDCIEFDDRLRWLDILDDVAFLAMDIEHLGRPDLAQYFTDWYLEYSGTPDVTSLRHHYIAYRAFVRAKVLSIQATQGNAHAATDAERYAELARQHLEAGQVRLILVGGAPGTGKTTLAGALADRLGAVRLSTDAVRQELALPASERYAPTSKTAAYRELLSRAQHALEHGESVVADATWGEVSMRALAQGTAAATFSTLTALECVTPVELAAARAEWRLGAGGSASDAGADVSRMLAAARVPWPEAARVDTAGPVQDAVEQALLAVTGPSAPALATDLR